MTTPKHSNLYVGNNTHVIELVDLKDPDGNLVSSASVSMTELLDSDGAAVAGVTPPIAMSLVSAGYYRGTLPDGLTLTVGDLYFARVKATSGGFKYDARETLIAKVRVT